MTKAESSPDFELEKDTPVSKISKNIYRSNFEVTFELNSNFRCLLGLYSK